MTLIIIKYFAGIQDTIGIKQRFNAFHPLQTGSVFGSHVFSLSQPDAMLPGSGTAQLNGFGDQTLGDFMDQIPLFLIAFFTDNVQMHITVSGVAEVILTRPVPANSWWVLVINSG